MKKIIIKNKFQLFDDYWNPKIIGSINDHDVKLAKVKGEFVWHNHENEDELFLVIKGKLIIEFQDKKVELNEGKFYARFFADLTQLYLINVIVSEAMQ